MPTSPSDERAERLHKAAGHAHALTTMLVSWYAVPPAQRGSVLGEGHLLNILEVLQQSTQELVTELRRGT
ncbi:hypothetical protein [Xanthomonas sacchari]|uniref:hypothetical protein n=1 Tax=Xanthomonas sacchari TaxID=56458 RepID=UPI0024360809|nr:hypothetical protein [Xanthomonas sacchari]